VKKFAIIFIYFMASSISAFADPAAVVLKPTQPSAPAAPALAQPAQQITDLSGVVLDVKSVQVARSKKDEGASLVLKITANLDLGCVDKSASLYAAVEQTSGQYDDRLAVFAAGSGIGLCDLMPNMATREFDVRILGSPQKIVVGRSVISVDQDPSGKFSASISSGAQ
jgi:hypothetical protein